MRKNRVSKCNFGGCHTQRKMCNGCSYFGTPEVKFNHKNTLGHTQKTIIFSNVW